MKKVLGLDIGTNSIGWAFIETNAYDNPEVLDGRIIQLGSRIIPMDGEALSKFESGTPISRAAGRRMARSARRLNHRYKLRRTRLIKALQILGWLPHDFPTEFKKLTHHSINQYLPYSEELRREAAEYFGIAGKKTAKGSDAELPEDWLIYFLKVKALHHKVTLPELARILYHFNQRRGFKSSRKDNKMDDQDTEKKYPLTEKWVEIVKVTAIEATGTEKDDTFYELTCKTPGLEFKAVKKRKTPPDWLNKDIEVEITRKTLKDGSVSYNIAEVDPNAWESRKLALEKDIEKENLYLSEYYLKNIKANRDYPIKQRIVDRSFYQKEFSKIWETQSKYYKDEFSDKRKLELIADTFYVHNREKNRELKSRDLYHLFFNDIIYYQRGLKSQKAFLANCQFETKQYKTKEGEIKEAGVKVVSKSAPCFQEFRIWQTIHNLKLFRKEEIVDGRLRINVDVTSQYLTEENKEKLFELFDNSAEVSHDSMLRLLGFTKDFIEQGEKTFAYRFNYPDDRNFPGNETKALFRRVFRKHKFDEGERYLADRNLFERLWHIIYSLPEEKDIASALSNPKHFSFPDSVIKHLSKLPEFKSQYASISSRAINKMLPLMRLGKYWTGDFDPKIKTRLEKLINGEYDETISDKAREEISKLNLQSLEDFKGLPSYIAAYIIYGRHSERSNSEKYDTWEDIKVNELIPNNSLRNPVVEKTIREALFMVKEIWKNENLGRPDYIHVELGRELKNNNEDRKKIAEQNYKNKVERDRVIALLRELKYPRFNENSLADLDKFRIWKEAGGKEGDEKFDQLFKANKAEFVKDAEIEKYKYWAEQNYRSPYSGKPIPLSELFTEKYQVDHIIPRSRFYDDSTGNKVVVESEFNDRKGNRLAMQFIEEFQGKDIEMSGNEKRRVLTVEEYKQFVDNTFKNAKKRRYLKMYEVPEDFIERQLNDTKYISRTVAQFLRPIAKGTNTDEGVVYTNGAITSDLKAKWGLNKLWKEILRPRFERLEGILGEKLIFENDNNNGDYRFAKDYKRIDHRHHALDALVIACTSRGHIKYLNSLNSLSNNKSDIKRYGEWSKWRYLLKKKKSLQGEESGMTEFSLPWEGFYAQAKEAIESVIVSHKPTAKLISKAVNKYYKWQEVEPGKWEKKVHFQSAPDDDDKYWVAVRQSLFGQPYGKIHIAEYKKNVNLKAAIKAQIQFLNRPEYIWNSEDWRIAKSDIRKKIDGLIRQYSGDEKRILKHLESEPLKDNDGVILQSLDLLQFKKYASKRVPIDESFTLDKINSLPYSRHEKNQLVNLLRSHLEEFGNPREAFKGEAMELLYRKLPFKVNKVTRMESGSKIEINNKLLDGDKGVNQFFVVEIRKEVDKKTGEEKIVRKYYTPNFLDCIERLAKGLPIHDINSDSRFIVLSPGDLVYVPEKGEDLSHIDWKNRKKLSERIYIMKSSNNYQCFFVPAFVAKPIIDTVELGPNNKSERAWDKQMVKENFIKLKINRLGDIMPACE